MIALGLATIVNYNGNDTAKVFAFPFRTFEESDVKVKVRDLSDGSETDITLGVDFSISVVNQLGGDVTLIDAGQAWISGAGNLDNGYRVYIWFGASNLKQLTKFRDLGRNAPTRIEDAVDRLTMLIKGFFEGIGDVARSIKLPTNVHPDEFDPVLPSGFNSSANKIIAINDTLDGWKMFDGDVIQEITDFLNISYTPGAVQVLGAGGVIVVTKNRRQHVRVKSDGGAKALATTLFGVDPALFRDGMEIVVEGTDDADYLTIAEDDNQYGFIGNGGIELKRGIIATFIYNQTQERFKLKSSGAW